MFSIFTHSNSYLQPLPVRIFLLIAKTVNSVDSLFLPMSQFSSIYVSTDRLIWELHISAKWRENDVTHAYLSIVNNTPSLLCRLLNKRRIFIKFRTNVMSMDTITFHNPLKSTITIWRAAQIWGHHSHITNYYIVELQMWADVSELYNLRAVNFLDNTKQHGGRVRSRTSASSLIATTLQQRI